MFSEAHMWKRGKKIKLEVETKVKIGNFSNLPWFLGISIVHKER